MLANKSFETCSDFWSDTYNMVNSMLNELGNKECCHVTSNKKFIFTVEDKKALNLLTYKILLSVLSDESRVSGVIPSLCIRQVFNNFSLDNDFEKIIEENIIGAPSSETVLFEIATALSSVCVFEEMIKMESVAIKKATIKDIASCCVINSEAIRLYDLPLLNDIISESGKGIKVRRTIKAFIRLGYMVRWFNFSNGGKNESYLSCMLESAVKDYFENLELEIDYYESEISFWNKFFEAGIEAYEALPKDVKHSFKFAEELIDIMVLMKDGKYKG